MCESHPYCWAKNLLENFGTVSLHSDNTFSFKCEDESFRSFLKELYQTISVLKGHTSGLYEVNELINQFIELFSFKYDLLDPDLDVSISLLIRVYLIRGLRLRTDLVSYKNSNENLKNAIEVIIDIYSYLS